MTVTIKAGTSSPVNIATAFGMTLLDGSANSLLRPYELKSLTLNDNATIDGSRAIVANRKAKSRDLTLNFLVQGASPIDLQAKIDKAIQALSAGEAALTITELSRTWFLTYLSCDKYARFGTNGATLSIKFKELNPKRRA